MRKLPVVFGLWIHICIDQPITRSIPPFSIHFRLCFMYVAHDGRKVDGTLVSNAPCTDAAPFSFTIRGFLMLCCILADPCAASHLQFFIFTFLLLSSLVLLDSSHDIPRHPGRPEPGALAEVVAISTRETCPRSFHRAANNILSSTGLI